MRTRRWRVIQGLVAGCFIAAILVFSRANTLFTRIRLQLTDIYFVPSPVYDTTIIVALDNASFQEYGRSPSQWSRTVYADLIDFLDDAGARVAAFDILFSEQSPDDDALAQAIRDARQSDTRLRTVVAAAGVPPAAAVTDPDNNIHTIRFERTVEPTSTIGDVVDYLGYVNTFPDVDGSVRRQPTVIQTEDGLAVSWSLATYLAYLRIPGAALSQVLSADEQTLQIAQTRAVQVDELGFWSQNFFGPPFNMQDATFPVVSLVDVLSGEVDPERFEDKIVLIGLINSTGITDQYTVPSAPRGQLMAGVEIQANAIETLLQNRVIHEQSIVLQHATIIVLSIGASVLYMQLNWYFKLISWGVLSLLGLVIASILFERNGEIVNLFDTLLALALPIVATTGIDITNEITRRRQSEFLLHSVVHVSQQRLRLSKILPHIGEDIHRIVPSAQILIWRCDQHPDKPQEIYRWPDDLQLKETDLISVAHDVARTGKASIQRTQVVLPIAWRKRLIAVYAVKVTGITGIPRRTVSLLQRLAEQLAPSMESAFLYTEVEQQGAIRDAILNGSPAGILVLDDTLQITGMNHMLDNIFKVQFSGFIDQPFMAMLDFIGIQDKNRHDIMNALQEGKPFRRDLTLRSHIFSLEAAPLEEFKRWVLVLTEITHLIQLTQLKTYIIRMLSHDLGNPLSRVLGYTQLIVSDRDRFPEDHQQFLDAILSSGEEMDRIIAEVLALEELRSSEFTLTGLDMRELVENFCKQYAPNMLPKKQTFTWDVPDDPLFVSGNHRQLTQVLMNLLSNASKYTPEGGHIQVTLTKHDTIFARLSVKDDGYGIPEKSQAQIFTEFFRVKSDITREIEGTGLGLSMVKVVINNHNGRVWFESAEGAGTTFFVELPLFKDKSH